MELEYFKRLASMREVLNQAGLARGPGGKKFRHQFRIPNRVLQRSADALVVKAAAIQRCRSFDDLIRMVQQVIGQLKGIGKLTVYDTAVRIGGFLGCGPDKVFLHAGTKDGAESLGFDGTRPFLIPEELPKAFRQLSPREIEDCLCIYKRQLRRLASRRRASRASDS
jgi:hypothetical protein